MILMKLIRNFKCLAVTSALWLSLALVACGGAESKNESLFSSEVVRSAESALSDKLAYLGIEAIDFGDSLTSNEKAAMTWLYAYSYTPDILDHSPEFYRANIDVAIKARQELPWGSSVPLDQWRAFVLPLRVNNEILDDFRTTYYEELRDLVKDMTMEQAVIELNHWAHQHITYAPSDGRTSSPLATLRNALGRCGEQSTFFVSVLRTVGIPARQVYTPRWAHTDDNHAWVEAWVDGEWHYLGASEPAPVLDHAWFDAPVLRAMLLHTRAFGPYVGKEEWLGADLNTTELNVSENYIPVAPAMVTVVDKEGKPLEGVKVTFRIYNYADLYPAVTRTTNRLGEASVELGFGDVVVVASRSPQEMAIGKLTNKEGGGTLKLTLGDWSEVPSEMHLTITPPIERVPQIAVTEEMEHINAKRMEENNALRQSYTDTFPTDEQANSLATELGLSGEKAAQLSRLYKESRGYHREIADFLRSSAQQGKVQEAIAILASLTDKDLHDVNIDVLRETLSRDLTSVQWSDADLFSPRVMLEHLYPVQKQLDEAIKEIKSAHPEWETLSIAEKAKTLAMVVDGFKVDESYNPRGIVMSPATVWQYKVGDLRSLQVLLVRLLRTAGISAKYDTANGVILFKDEQQRAEILPFKEKTESEEVSADCQLLLSYKPEGYLKTPKYETNFSIGYVDDEGQLSTYGFDWQLPYDQVSGAKLLHNRNYLLTGTRLANGAVLMALRKQECGKVAPLLFDQDETAIGVIGSLNAESLYHDLSSDSDKSLISSTGRGYYLLILGRAHHEPTDHILRDMQAIKGADGKLLLPTVVLINDPSAELKSLLPEAIWGEDKWDIEYDFVKSNELSGRLDKPVVIIADTFNRVVFISQGYTIGIGERVAQIVEELKSK